MMKSQTPPPAIDLRPLLIELGAALLLFQNIEHRIKFLLPHLVLSETGELAPDEGWSGRNKYLDSKEMLGSLVKALHQRTHVDHPARIEAAWREIVQGRNEVMHHFVRQPFAQCENPADLQSAIEYVRSRRMRAVPMHEMLDAILKDFLKELDKP